MYGSVNFRIQFHFIHISCSEVIQSTHTYKHTRTHSLSIDRKNDKLFRSWCGINFLDVMAFLLSPFESGSKHFNANPRNCLLHIEIVAVAMKKKINKIETKQKNYWLSLKYRTKLHTISKCLVLHMHTQTQFTLMIFEDLE